MTDHLHQLPGMHKTDWATPPALFAKYDAEFHFTLDVCATADNAKCTRYFTPALNGLGRRWADDTCWCNPPYGRELGAWMKKAYEESQKGATVVCLVPARTCTAWWHEYAEKGERRFIRGRVKFVGARWTAPFPSAVVIFRSPRSEKLEAEREPIAATKAEVRQQIIDDLIGDGTGIGMFDP